MSSPTPNYAFTLPAVNSSTDEDLWGTELNANWSLLDTILNLPSDTQFKIHNASDATKLGRFNLANVVTGTTAVYLMPSASTSLVGTDTTDTLTNKTLTSPTITTPTVSSPTMTGTPVAPTAAAGTNTTQVATTAFVQTAVGSGSNGSVQARGTFYWDGSAIQTSGLSNVSSITRNGTGDYTINFTSAISDTNYQFTGASAGASKLIAPFNATKNTGSLRVFVTVSTTGTAADLNSATRADFVIFR